MKDMSGFGSQTVATRKSRLAHNHMSTNTSLISPILFEYISDRYISAAFEVKFCVMVCFVLLIAYRHFGYTVDIVYCHFDIGFIKPEYVISA